MDRIISWIYTRKIWGPRCADFDAGCHACCRWAAHDEMFPKRKKSPPTTQG